MIYTCDDCHKNFELRPGEGFIGSLDENQNKCSLTLTILCKDCVPKPMKEKKTNGAKTKDIHLILENDDLIRDCITEIFSDRDDIALIKGVRDAIKYEDPRALGKIIYPRARQYVLTQLEKNNDS